MSASSRNENSRLAQLERASESSFSMTTVITHSIWFGYLTNPFHALMIQNLYGNKQQKLSALL